MDVPEIFGLQFFMSLIVYAAIAKWFVKPWLAGKPLRQSLIPLIFPHAFRYIGMLFLVSPVVTGPLPDAFAYPAAYGDLITSLLALLSLVALRGGWGLALPLVWLFNVVGTLDLVNALYQGIRLDVLYHFGAAWYIPTFLVPALLVSHLMIFTRLLKRGG